MRRVSLGLLVVVTLLTATATMASADDAKDEAIKKDRKHIEGTWRILALEVNGNKAKEQDAKKLTVVNGSDGTWSLRSEDKEINKGTSTFDPTKKPKTIDFTPTTGEDKGKQSLGFTNSVKKLDNCALLHRERNGPPSFLLRPQWAYSRYVRTGKAQVVRLSGFLDGAASSNVIGQCQHGRYAK